MFQGNTTQHSIASPIACGVSQVNILVLCYTQSEISSPRNCYLFLNSSVLSDDRLWRLDSRDISGPDHSHHHRPGWHRFLFTPYRSPGTEAQVVKGRGSRALLHFKWRYQLGSNNHIILIFFCLRLNRSTNLK